MLASDPQNYIRDLRWVCAIFFLALACRLIVFYSLGSFSETYFPLLNSIVDAASYNELARTLTENNQFLNKNGTPHTLWAPLYPLFISYIYRLMGEGFEAVVLVQIVISASMVWPIWFLLRPFIASRILLAMLFFFAIEPHIILSSNLIMSETLLGFFLMLFALLLFVNLIKGDTRSLLFTALFLGLAALTRVAAQYLWIVAVLSILILYKDRFSINRRIRQAFLFSLVYAAVVTPWMARNYHHYGYFSMSSGAGYNLLQNNVSVIEFENDSSINLKQNRENNFAQAEATHGLNKNSNPFELDSAYLDFALQKIADEFFVFALGHLYEMRKITLNAHESLMFIEQLYDVQMIDRHMVQLQLAGNTVTGLIPIYRTEALIAKLVLELYMGLLLFLMITYLILNLRETDPLLRPLASWCMIYLYFITISSASAPTRFLLAALPFLMFIAVYSSAQIARKFRAQKLL